MLHRVALVRNDVSEELGASIRVTRIGELGTLAVTSNWCMLQKNSTFTLLLLLNLWENNKRIPFVSFPLKPLRFTKKFTWHATVSWTPFNTIHINSIIIVIHAEIFTEPNVRYPLFSSDFSQNRLSVTLHNIKYHENLSSSFPLAIRHEETNAIFLQNVIVTNWNSSP
jgi:hypothetical protein